MTDVSEGADNLAEGLPPQWAAGERAAPPLVGDEREILTGFLEWHRTTFELKCSGLAPERLSDRSVPPSGLSLHGLVRHLAEAERWWFRMTSADEHVPFLYHSPDAAGQDFGVLDGDVEEAFTVWRAECARAREIVARTPSLEETAINKLTGEPVSLRGVLVHMIAEYARHNGHTDLLRERIDGAVGY
ncbi:DinB family protein [Streptomyces sp. DH10]|uniref:DinB family protein n=1 Tax=Streptomyces sp. DH10 TaxID=3040121 RepID=UPI0024434DB0|nr:DinB family protein [Streptomyces sp. DH10]MDG9708996.1 DinB family protein [Streptomyces sp. DH10]